MGENTELSLVKPASWSSSIQVRAITSTGNHDQIYNASGPLITFNCNTNINGDVPVDHYIISDNLANWNVDPSAFTYNGIINAEVFIDEVPVLPGGALAAFVGNECRGMQQNGLTGPTGKWIFVLSCHSNQESGELLSFKYYDPDTGEIVDIIENINFESGMIINDQTIPFPMNGFFTSDISLPVPQGWNWLSLNAFTQDMSANNILSSINAIDNDYIKNFTQSSTYYDGQGWSGSLNDLNNSDMFMTCLSEDGIIAFTGQAVDPVNNPIVLNQGWTWIAYSPNNELDIQEALISLNPQPGDYIKNQFHSSTYYDGFGWFGKLSQLKPFDGYKIRMAQSGTLIYPANTGAVSFTAPDINYISKTGDKNFDLIPGNFRYNGSITAEVIIDGQNAGAPGKKLYAFVGNDCRGKSDVIFFPGTDQYIYDMMIYSNKAESEEITFKLFIEEENRWFEFSETLSFEADMIEADAFDPFELRDGSFINSEWNNNRKLSMEVYPNPFNGKLNISFENPKQQHIGIYLYDSFGRRIKPVIDKTFQSGKYDIEMNISELPNGIYFIRMETKRNVFNKKVLKLR